MFGLDGAGKTCILAKAFQLKYPHLLADMPPTQGID